MPNTKVEPITKVCPQCGKNFQVGGRGRPRVKQIYDSKRCRALAHITKPKIKTLSLVHAAFVAGLFDGEGSVVLWDRGSGGRRQLRCTISNTFEPIHNWLVKVTGTGSIVRHVHPPEKGYKDALTWQVYGQNAVNLLIQMLPHLIIKRQKAVEAIKSQEIMTV